MEKIRSEHNNRKQSQKPEDDGDLQAKLEALKNKFK